MQRQQTLLCYYKNRTYHTEYAHSQGGFRQSSDIFRHTQADSRKEHNAAAADVQQWVYATYFNVSCLVYWLHFLTELISKSLVTVASLSVLSFVLLIGP